MLRNETNSCTRWKSATGGLPGICCHKPSAEGCRREAWSVHTGEAWVTGAADPACKDASQAYHGGRDTTC